MISILSVRRLLKGHNNHKIMNKYNNNYKHFKSFSCQSPIGMLKEAEDEVGRKLKVQSLSLPRSQE